LNGWVRNLPDGRVEALFSGPSDAVMAMVEWAKQGPPMAKVVQVEEKEETVDPSLPKFKTKRE
jgi:acylphosphatase